MKVWVWMASMSIASMLVVNPALADPTKGKGGGTNQETAERGNGKGKGKNVFDERQDRAVHRGERAPSSGTERPMPATAPSGTAKRHFEGRDRSIVREYYLAEYRSGHCPPGLAKKSNGCMAPGQAKKWRTGYPLPSDAVFHDLPRELVVRIGMPPPGYRYVRVASDILLIAIGTGMVIDAITDLGAM